MCRIFDDEEDFEETSEEILEKNHEVKMAAALLSHLYEPIYVKDHQYFIERDEESAEIGLLLKDESNEYCYIPFDTDNEAFKGKLTVMISYSDKDLSLALDVSQDTWHELIEHAIKRQDKVALDFLMNLTYRKEELCDYSGFDSRYAQIGIERHYNLGVVEEVIRIVNAMPLPEQLQEKRCTTFGDLYKGLNSLHILNEKKSKGYEDGTDALGCYSKNSTQKEICLYLDSIYEHHSNIRRVISFKDLVKIVYIHELFHAYFDVYNHKKTDEDVLGDISRYIEEPLAEYATLLTIKEDGELYDLAKNDIADKFTVQGCRQYGLGSEELGLDIVKKYKYMKYLLTKEDVNDYVLCICDLNSSKADCVSKLMKIFD